MEHTSIRRVGVAVKPQQPEALKTICRLIEWLDGRGIRLVGTPNLDRERIEGETGCVLVVVEPERLAATVDLIVVLGGDGTMIATSRMMGDFDVPVLGINYGTLGYLAEFRVEEMFSALESILEGDYRVDTRVRLSVDLVQGEEILMHHRVLNDVVINKSALARIIELEAHMDGQLISAFRADGLIISTPTGSTAYNLSAGGPVVYPSMNALIITPICPFTLSDRPIVVPDDALVELRLRTQHEDVVLTLDGQIGRPILPEHRVVIRKSLTPFRIVQPKNRNYFEVLREKLRWGK
ncbi:MAG TPA: NAD(+)/NADH kinase [Pyrinomonadaceae bacterium]|nr:NAD(+)/NADH kinase [Pyrinomonadaceae bacterium]